jgi:hypothetical protein
MSPINGIGNLMPGAPGLAPQPTWQEMLVRSHTRSQPLWLIASARTAD